MKCTMNTQTVTILLKKFHAPLIITTPISEIEQTLNMKGFS